MAKAASQDYLSSLARNKIYLILMFISVILFIFSVRQVYPIIVEVTDPLGLASKLAPTYWIGLAILVMKGLKND